MECLMFNAGSLPSWIAKADGRREPFDGYRISRTIYAVSETAGQVDPLLAQELADGVFHFLAAGGPTETITASEVTEAIVRVVRELGHPILARAIERRTISALHENEGLFAAIPIPGDCVSVQSSHDTSVAFPTQEPDLPVELRAAARDGWLRFLSPDGPKKLAGIVLPPPASPTGWSAAVAAAARTVSDFVAIDGRQGGVASPDSARQLRHALQIRRLRAVVNFNVSEPADDDTLDTLLSSPTGTVRVDWHLSENDVGPGLRDRLIALGRRVVAGLPLAFVVDRSSGAVSLAEGLDSECPAILGAVGLNLPRLLEAVRRADDPVTVFLSKLGSLARLGIRAGRAWRDALRGFPAVSAGFLLDRAQLLIVPEGEETVVEALAGYSSGDIVHDSYLALHAALTRDVDRLQAVLDGPPCAIAPAAWRLSHLINESASALPTVSGQLRTAARIHAAVGRGTAQIVIPANTSPPAEAGADWLEFAVCQPGLDRFRFVRRAKTYRQLTAGW
jgi:hypothetical protein